MRGYGGGRGGVISGGRLVSLGRVRLLWCQPPTAWVEKQFRAVRNLPGGVLRSDGGTLATDCQPTHNVSTAEGTLVQQQSAVLAETAVGGKSLS